MIGHTLIDDYEFLLSPIQSKLLIGGSKIAFSKEEIHLPSWAYSNPDLQAVYEGYLFCNAYTRTFKHRVPKEVETKTELFIFVLLTQSWVQSNYISKRFFFVSDKVDRYLSFMFNRYGLKFRKVRRKREAFEVISDVIKDSPLLKERHASEKKSARADKRRLKGYEQKLEKEKELLELKKTEWQRVADKIAVIQDGIRELQRNIKESEFTEEKKELREKIKKRRKQIAELKTGKSVLQEAKGRVKESKENLKQLLKDGKRGEVSFYINLNDYFREQFIKDRIVYKSKGKSELELQYPFVYDQSKDIEVYRDADHEIEDFQLADSLTDVISYWKSLYRQHIQTKSNTYQVRGLKRGKLDRFRLHKKFRLFAKEEQVKKRTHALSICISANTTDESLLENLKVAYVLCEVLRVAKVATEVIVFHAEQSEEVAGEDFKGKYLRGNHNVTYHVLKDYRDIDLDRVLAYKGSCITSFDAEAIRYCGNRLLRRKEKKWLLYLAGRSPESHTRQHVRAIIEEAEAEGVKVVVAGGNWLSSISRGGRGVSMSPGTNRIDSVCHFFLQRVSG